MGSWEDVFPPADREVFAASGHGGDVGLGDRAALIIVDVNYHFVGDRGQSLIHSIRRWPYSCGPNGWDAIEAISQMLRAARSARMPVIFTTGLPPGVRAVGPGRWADKGSRSMTGEQMLLGQVIPDPIAPIEGELVIEKAKPSAFFGTPLPSYLIDHRVDSLLVCGATTSGCIRATVTDAFSYNLRVNIVSDATFDRSELSHRVGLFEMHQKYADVVSLDEGLRRIAVQMPEIGSA